MNYQSSNLKAVLLFLTTIVAIFSCTKEDTTVKRTDNAMKITNAQHESCQNPCFSPDGKYIVYTRFLNGYNIGPSELVIIKIDGSDEKVIVPASYSDNVNVPFGSWVDDKICFSSDRDEGADEIWMVNRNGTGLTKLTTHDESTGIYYIEPVFNPQNTDFIAFEYVTGKNDKTAIHQIALLNTTDGQIKLLTNGTYNDRLPSWSNDGSKILFQRIKYGQDEGWDIYIADIEVTNAAPLSNIRSISQSVSDDTDCSWSYNDKYILSSSNYGGLDLPNIFMFPIDKNSDPIRITSSSSNEEGAASQSHDGKYIAFESHNGESEDYPSDIWIIELK